MENGREGAREKYATTILTVGNYNKTVADEEAINQGDDEGKV